MMKQIIFNWLCAFPLLLSLDDGTNERPGIAFHPKFVNPYALILRGRSMLKEGDLVVRLSRDRASWFIKKFNRQDQQYTHAGIVLFHGGRPYVYHMIDGNENPDGKMKEDSLSGFADPKRNEAYAIFRYDLQPLECQKLRQTVLRFYHQGSVFDNDFNYETDDKMYCSELISKSLCVATSKRINIRQEQLTPVEAGFFAACTHHPLSYANHLKIVPIDALYTNQNCRLVKAFRF